MEGGGELERERERERERESRTVARNFYRAGWKRDINVSLVHLNRNNYIIVCLIMQ